MADNEIPLTSSSQTLTIPIAGKTYYIEIHWRGIQYILDLYDNSKTPILLGIALVTGENLLKPFDYLNLGFAMQIRTDVDKFLNPEYLTLGVSSHLIVSY